MTNIMSKKETTFYNTAITKYLYYVKKSFTLLNAFIYWKLC